MPGPPHPRIAHQHAGRGEEELVPADVKHEALLETKTGKSEGGGKEEHSVTDSGRRGPV